ncbi:MAG: hypothetical protein KKG59_02080 [Nanoarchaeota archaeon]|nr:hypothetical protein [Nanoarchaeota archaeon]
MVEGTKKPELHDNVNLHEVLRLYENDRNKLDRILVIFDTCAFHWYMKHAVEVIQYLIRNQNLRLPWTTVREMRGLKIGIEHGRKVKDPKAVIQACRLIDLILEIVDEQGDPVGEWMKEGYEEVYIIRNEKKNEMDTKPLPDMPRRAELEKRVMKFAPLLSKNIAYEYLLGKVDSRYQETRLGAIIELFEKGASEGGTPNVAVARICEGWTEDNRRKKEFLNNDEFVHTLWNANADTADMGFLKDKLPKQFFGDLAKEVRYKVNALIYLVYTWLQNSSPGPVYHEFKTKYNNEFESDAKVLVCYLLMKEDSQAAHLASEDRDLPELLVLFETWHAYQAVAA